LLKSGFTSAWQLRQSCGSPIFTREVVANPGFSALTLLTYVIELARFLPVSIE
jgi:hypothetical protein